MIEYIANRVVNEKDEAIRFIGVGNFVVLNNKQMVVAPDDFDEDPKKLFGDEFNRMAEFRTFYDLNEKAFRLVEMIPNEEQPEHYVKIPYDGGEIDGWMVGRLDPRSAPDQQSNSEGEKDDDNESL